MPRSPRRSRGLWSSAGAVALLAALGGTANAAPQSVRQPALRAMDERSLLDSVADKGSALITHVRDGVITQVRDGATDLVDGAAGLVGSAMNFLGVRYQRGGNSAETGFDCSGFTRYVFENSIGRVLPHRADEQANAPDLVKVDQKDLKPGDLVFFNTLRRTFSHVGIYLGDGKFIHSPRTGESVRIEDMKIAYWARHFTGARRVPELASAADATQPSAAAGHSTMAALASLLGGSVIHPVAATATARPELALSPSLNPSGLKVGSTLPALPERGVAGFVPSHQPFAPALADR